MAVHFAAELEALKQKLLTMAALAETAVSRALKAIVDRDDDLARQVEESDSEIDRLEMEVDEAAISLLSKAPLASDLRLITVAMKISHDLERVGDEATTIARRARDLNREPPPAAASPELPRMAEQALSMLKRALDSFVHHDPARARQIIPEDKEVDRLNKHLYRELANLMVQDPQTITRSLNLMTVSKCLERIADHATNIAEEVVYVCEAIDVRHSAQPPPAAPGE